jgi:hypothetical protein
MDWQPTQKQIEELAHQRWQSKGRPVGQDTEIWAEAEKDLKEIYELAQNLREAVTRNQSPPTPVEFFPADRYARTVVPYPSKLRKLYCWITGGHHWRKFLWGGIVRFNDCDCCTKCFKMRGPMPLGRNTEVFPCYLPW